MYSGTAKRRHSAAWRVSVWGSLWWAIGTLVVFVFLHHSVAMDTQSRTDTWVKGAARTMSEIAQGAPPGARRDALVREIEEAASREVPGATYDGDGDADDQPVTAGQNKSVFFLQTDAQGGPVFYAGQGNAALAAAAILAHKSEYDPFSVRVAKGEAPYRVSGVALADGGHVYLGLSEQAMLQVLNALLLKFAVLWLVCVLLGFGIIFWVTSGVLKNVREMTLAASSIGEADLRARVPVSAANDEVAELARTLNVMLERIQRSVEQLQTITGSLAHDLRSPLTAIRAKLEMSVVRDGENEPVETAIEEIDRLTEMLTQTLDVAEAQAGALRMQRTAVDLDQLLRMMADLYQPSMNDKDLTLDVHSAGPLQVWADEALMHRVLANLFENEIKHLPAGATVCLCLSSAEGRATLTLEDDGPGFADEVKGRVFERGVRGLATGGHGLGLAFVEAVVASHGGAVTAENRARGGARLCLELPLWDGQSEGVREYRNMIATCGSADCLCNAAETVEVANAERPKTRT
jgi:signal transduction histidine kinase